MDDQLYKGLPTESLESGKRRSFLSINIPKRLSLGAASIKSASSRAGTPSIYSFKSTSSAGPQQDQAETFDFPITPLELYQPGDVITLEGFGGNFGLSDGQSVTLQDLLNISVGGVVVFTQPKANTPTCRYCQRGVDVTRHTCTKQVCMFREAYEDLRHSGFAVYGLSKDTPTENLAFKLKNNLPYTLISDEEGSLVEALGFHHWQTGRVVPGVIAIDKDGKVLVSLAGGLEATVDAVRPLICSSDAEPFDMSRPGNEMFVR